MLMLLFCVGNDRYTIESKRVIEVIPKMDLKAIHHAPEHIPGLFSYQSSIVPVIDLCHLIRGYPCRPYLSTRIILLNYQGCHTLTKTDTTQTNSSYILGLMAERVTGTFRKQETVLFNPGIKVDTAPYFGEIIADQQGMIQCIQVEYLLPELQRTSLL